MDPDAKAFNRFFTKSDASVASAKGTVTPPKHVSLLDYEVELALIFRQPIVSAATVTRENLKDYVFAVAIANDFSARDVQLPQTLWRPWGGQYAHGSSRIATPKRLEAAS